MSLIGLIILGSLVHNGTCKTAPKTETNTQIHNDLIELKTQNDEIESRLKTTIRNEITDFEIEIENRLTNKIKKEILESIMTKRMKDYKEGIENS